MGRDAFRFNAGNADIQKEVGQILSANESESRSWWKSVVGFVGVLVGASGVLVGHAERVQSRLVATPAADGRAAVRFLIKRVISLAMILGLGFILLVSFVVNTIISFVVDFIGSRFSEVETLVAPMNFFASLLIIACMLAAMYRYLPDARVTQRDASVGALFASLLFAVGLRCCNCTLS
ncbi:MAG: YhjD/YihY/BrkB family envelope integrity protein [Pirellulales bacterium]